MLRHVPLPLPPHIMMLAVPPRQPMLLRGNSLLGISAEELVALVATNSFVWDPVIPTSGYNANLEGRVANGGTLPVLTGMAVHSVAHAVGWPIPGLRG